MLPGEVYRNLGVPTLRVGSRGSHGSVFPRAPTPPSVSAVTLAGPTPSGTRCVGGAARVSPTSSICSFPHTQPALQSQRAHTDMHAALAPAMWVSKIFLRGLRGVVVILVGVGF